VGHLDIEEKQLWLVRIDEADGLLRVGGGG